MKKLNLDDCIFMQRQASLGQIVLALKAVGLSAAIYPSYDRVDGILILNLLGLHLFLDRETLQTGSNDGLLAIQSL